VDLPALDLVGSLASFNRERQTVLVVSHEASRTEASIFALNIVQQMSSRYNVVVMLLGGGVISDAFWETGAVVVRAFAARDNPELANQTVLALTQQVDLKFALVNGVESHAVLPELARSGVPTVNLIQEFIVQPKYIFLKALFWSSEVVFPAAIAFKNARTEFWHVEDWPTASVLPPGHCAMPKPETPGRRVSEEHTRLARLLRPAGDFGRKFVVLGTGVVQHQKGADLFIQCAAHVREQAGAGRIRFVWICCGPNPEPDARYSAYLADEIRRASLQDVVAFVGETSAIDAAYEEADVFLLSSRWDPLPTAAIDAMTHGLPVLCFENATAIAEILIDASLRNACVAKHLDVADMARKIVALLESSARREYLGARAKVVASERFDMLSYIAALENRAAAACGRLQQERRDAADICRQDQLRLDFAVSPYVPYSTREEAIALYVKGWASGVRCRKPVPGFHPALYKASHGLHLAGADPYADYLRAGRPAGPWQMAVITEKTPISTSGQELRVAVHMHVFYPELAGAFIERLSLNALRADLFVSVSNDEARNSVLNQLSGYKGRVCDVQVVVNRGRDIGPMLTGFGADLVRDYDIVGHFHTKASQRLSDERFGQSWYCFILENLLGGTAERMADRILGKMAVDGSLGMVFPDDPYVMGWYRSRSHARALADRLGLNKELPDHFSFPVGNMFWARTAVLKPLVDLGLSWNDYPEEPIAEDGTILHAIERLTPIVTETVGLRCMVTAVEGISR